MTPTQFVALARLMRMQPDGDAYRSAELVLCAGMRTSEAARIVGCSSQVVTNAVRRCRAALKLVEEATGNSDQENRP